MFQNVTHRNKLGISKVIILRGSCRLIKTGCHLFMGHGNLQVNAPFQGKPKLERQLITVKKSAVNAIWFNFSLEFTG